MSSDQSFDSVQAAIDREAKRRRRVLLTYLGLLIVPIVIGGLVLAKAPSETAAVARQVTPIVRNEVAADIEPRITEAVTAKAEPIIRERVSREVRESVEPQIAAATTDLKGNLTSIDQEVKTLRVSVDANERLLAPVRRYTEDLSAIRTEQTTFRDTVTSDAGVQKRDLQETQARLKQIENQLEEVRVSIQRIEARLNGARRTPPQ